MSYNERLHLKCETLDNKVRILNAKRQIPHMRNTLMDAKVLKCMYVSVVAFSIDIMHAVILF